MNTHPITTFNNINISDAPLWDMWMSMYHLAVISVADELGVFSCININNTGLSIEEIASKLNSSNRAIQIRYVSADLRQNLELNR